MAEQDKLDVGKTPDSSAGNPNDSNRNPDAESRIQGLIAKGKEQEALLAQKDAALRTLQDQALVNQDKLWDYDETATILSNDPSKIPIYQKLRDPDYSFDDEYTLEHENLQTNLDSEDDTVRMQALIEKNTQEFNATLKHLEEGNKANSQRLADIDFEQSFDRAYVNPNLKANAKDYSRVKKDVLTAIRQNPGAYKLEMVPTLVKSQVEYIQSIENRGIEAHTAAALAAKEQELTIQGSPHTVMPLTEDHPHYDDFNMSQEDLDKETMEEFNARMVRINPNR